MDPRRRRGSSSLMWGLAQRFPQCDRAHSGAGSDLAERLRVRRRRRRGRGPPEIRGAQTIRSGGCMQTSVLSTDAIPGREHFAVWRGMFGDRLSARDGDEDGRLVRSRNGSVARIRCRADGPSRDPHDIARREWRDHFFLFRELGPGSRFRWGRGELVTRRGELAIGDPAVPLAADRAADYDYELWMFPRRLLDPHLPAARRPRAHVLTGPAGLIGIIKACLDSFAAELDALDDGETDAVADTFCRLLAAACGESADDQREAARGARLEEAKRAIDRQLANPALTPRKAASALKMSLRQLNLLFAPSGEGVAQYILRRRLEECRAAIEGPVAERSVSDIAFAWGFNSLATFHRNFRQAFGATPGELRRQATSDEARPGQTRRSA